MVVLCGPAACGKSTFAQRHFRPTQIISSDWARACVCDDERDQRFNAQAFALVHFLLEQRLTLNRLCVVDSTALTAAARKELLDLAKGLQVPIVAMLFNVPLETCAERDQKRERSVGRAVIERQYQIFEQAKAAIRQEGFDQILELQDGDLDKVQIEIIFRPVARTPQRPLQPEPGSVRRPDRAAAPSGLRTGEPRVSGMPVRATPVVRPAQPAAAPRPVTPPASPPAPAASATPTAPAPAADPTQPSALPAPAARPAETPPNGES
jgi:protein phosphatase